MYKNKYNIESELVNKRSIKSFRAREVATEMPIILQVSEGVKQFGNNPVFRNDKPEVIVNKHEGILSLIEPHPENNYYVYEDYEGLLLSEFIKTYDFTIESFLDIAINITKTVAFLHSKNILIKDVCPDNLLINTSTYKIKFLNLLESVFLNEAKFSEGEEENIPIQYISPEQTGRVNIKPDFRSDLYSLGVTLYELMLKKTPFNGETIAAIVHAQIAQKVVPPFHENSDIPEIVSEIICKLLEKEVERRYQTAEGLAFDLETCLHNIFNLKNLHFALDEYNNSCILKIPEKLYGRIEEIEVLAEKYEHVKNGTKEIVSIAGRPGVGKSELVRQFFSSRYNENVFFLEGKYEQYQNRIPYYALKSATSKFVNLILSKDKEEFSNWSIKIQNAIGVYGRVLTDIIPEMENVIGKQPELPETNSREAKMRLLGVFKNLLKVMCSKEHPLVLFLDDWQWADDVSIELLKEIASERTIEYLMLIIAYRSNEVDEMHPFVQAQNFLINMNVPLSYLKIKNLTLPSIENLLRDSLSISKEESNRLAEIILDKTNGNPFFLKTFVLTLFEEGLIKYDKDAFIWIWEEDRIKNKKLTNNVVDLLTSRIKFLDKDIVNVLQFASCIGNRFTKSTLQIITQTSNTELTKLLNLAEQERYVMRIQENVEKEQDFVKYSFLHDTVQQAFYDSISTENKKWFHSKIGHLLLSGLSAQEQDDRLYEIVNHLNAGIHNKISQEEKITLLSFNERAMHKAISELAYETSMQYRNIVDSFINDSQFSNYMWENNYSLMIKVQQVKSSVEFLNSYFEEAENTILEGVANAQTNLDKAELYYILIIQNTLNSDYYKAIDIARTALSYFEINLPDTDFEKYRDEELNKVYNFFAQKGVEGLVQLPIMTNPEKKSIVKLLITMGPPCYRSHPKLWSVIVPKVVNICMEYGNVPQIGYSYTALGGLIGWVRSDFEKTKKLGEAATYIMNNTFDNLSDRSVFYLMNGSSVRHWSQHFVVASKDYERAYEIGIKSGNLQYTAYAYGHNMYTLYFQGYSLLSLKDKIDKYLAFSYERVNKWAIDLLNGGQMIVNYLLEDEDIVPNFTEIEAEYLQTCTHNKNVQVECIYYILQSFTSIVLRNIEKAKEYHSKADELLYTVGTQGLLPWPEHIYNKCLILIAEHEKSSIQDKKLVEEQLKREAKFVEHWASFVPDNYIFKHYHIQAQLLKMNNMLLEATELFDKAINEAINNKYYQHAALINEEAYRMWQSNGKIKFATPYIHHSIELYRKWGAQRKVKQLEKEIFQKDIQSIEDKKKNILNEIDLDTIYSFSHTLSEEVNVRKLTKVLVDIAMKSARADRAVVLYMRKDILTVNAENDTENTEVVLYENIPMSQFPKLPHDIINYTINSRKKKVIEDVSKIQELKSSKYVQNAHPKSIICLPLLNRGSLVGVLYLENKLLANSFNEKRIELLEYLSTQMAISIENAMLYENLERRVEERTKELENSEKKLKEANAAKDKFFSIIAHDLRSPFSGIMGITDILITQAEECASEQNLYLLKSLKGAVDNTFHLLENLLKWALSQGDKINYVPIKISLAECITSAKRINSEAANKKDITLQIDVNNECYVYADEDMLSTVLHNLLSNAIKFTARKGMVLVSCKSIAHKHMAEISVIDNGIGMDEKKIKNLFDLNNSDTSMGTEHEKGTGLGLLLCKEFVERNGGTLHVTSELGKGSIFSFTVPMP